MKSRFYSGALLLALALGAPGQNLPAPHVTAFALVKEGDKFVDPRAKDKVTEIRSEKSEGSLAPDVWYIDYQDPSATFKTTEIKFVAGQKVEITQPRYLLDVFGGTKLMESRKLKVDSDRALAVALKEPRLKKSDVQAVQFWLERTESSCTWRLHFWAGRPGNPNHVDDIGELYISSRTGEVIKNNLHVKSAD